ncbi:MAG TPA: hypothetical protein VFM18_18660 [Methanosarcina sp.]|nr:hypothetical protein [Methanosarcina sp.]
MFKWICNRLVKIGLSYEDDKKQPEKEEYPKAIVGGDQGYGPSGTPSIDMDRAIRFNVLRCNGGVVLETRSYDVTPSTSNAKTSSYQEPRVQTHIIHEADDVAARIGEIVSIELLRN